VKKWLWIAAALLAAVVFGIESGAGMDVGMLQPVQIVVVKRVGADVMVQTDTMDQGVGVDFASAVENMKASASGEIFLETADHLLLAPECVDFLEEVMQLLRPSCTVCLLDGEPDMEKLADFLKIHVPSVTMAEYRAGIGKLQTLKSVEGRMRVVS
jgi:hypothetical protein